MYMSEFIVLIPIIHCRTTDASKYTWPTSASLEHRLLTQALAAETWNYSSIGPQYPVSRKSSFTRPRDQQ